MTDQPRRPRPPRRRRAPKDPQWGWDDPMPGPRAVGSLLGDVTRSFGNAGAVKVALLAARWAELVGQDVAAHTRPATMKNRTLTILVDDPAWASQLRFLERQLLETLRDQLRDEAPRAIAWRVDNRP